jgi:O-antigen ligase
MSEGEKISLLFIKIFLFLIPLSLILVCPGYFCNFNLLFPYITGKAIFFRALIQLSALLLIIFLVSNKQYIPKKNDYLFYSSILLFLGITLINIFSIRPYISFWGNAERMEGVWGLFHFLLWFWVLYIYLKIDPNFKKSIFYSFLITSYIISIIEISQGLKGEIRPNATLGNATYVGFFGILMIFLSIYFLKYIKEKFVHYIIYLSIILNLAAIFISQSRGAILALFGAIVVSLIYYFLSSKTKLSIKISVIIALLIFSFAFYQFLKTDYAFKIIGIKRIAETIKDPRTYMARWIAWHIFWDGFKAKPLIGYGLENSPVVFFKFFNYNLFNYEEAIFDRPHNKYIEILVTTGILGAILWLIFFISIVYSIFKNEDDRFYKSALLGLFTSYILQNFVLFDVQASYLPFFFGLSLLSTPMKENKQKLDFLIAFPIVSFSIGLFLIFFALNIFHLYIVDQVIKGLSAPYPEGLDKFYYLSSFNTQFLPEIAIMASRYLEENISKIHKGDEIYKFLEIFERAYKKDPYDTRIFNSLITHLTRIIDAKRRMGLDYSSEYKEAIQLFNHFVTLYPKFPDLEIQYAQFLKGMGEKEKALEILKDVRNKYKESPRVLYYLGITYLDLGYTKEALESINEAIARHLYPNNPLQYLIAIRIYMLNNQKDKAQKFIDEYLQKFNDTSSKELLEKFLKP